MAVKCACKIVLFEMYLFIPFKVLLLTDFKHSPEDEDCPVPEDVRDTLGEFHNDLLLHCGEETWKKLTSCMHSTSCS